MSKILGIDASLTATGICVLDINSLNNREIYTETLENDLKGIERILYIEKCIMEYAKDVDLVVMENYAYDAKYNREKLAELQGVIKRRLYLMNKKLILIDTSNLKKVLTGESKNPTSLKTKEWVMQYTKNRYKIDFKGKDDECDAFGLSLIGLFTIVDLEEFNIINYIKGDIKEVVDKIKSKEKSKPKIKKNLSYYFNLPYNIVAEKKEEGYLLSIPYLEVSGVGSTLKKAIKDLEKNRNSKVRELRKNKKRIMCKDTRNVSFVQKRF